MLAQQLDASDNEAVLQELQQLEDLALQEELQHMPSVPKTEPQQAQQQPAAATPEAAAAAAAVQIEEELPSVPAKKVRSTAGIGFGVQVGSGVQRLHVDGKGQTLAVPGAALSGLAPDGLMCLRLLLA